MRALLSVANRVGIAALARDLLALGVEIFATDGTRDYLAAEGIPVASVYELTEGPPLVGGQVKTFHHAIYAGILARRDVPAQLDELSEQGIGLIDLVVVNVKAFAPAIGVKLIGIADARPIAAGAASGGRLGVGWSPPDRQTSACCSSARGPVAPRGRPGSAGNGGSGSRPMPQARPPR